MNFSDFCQSKILHLPLLLKRLNLIRKNGRSIATINGGFDLLHSGHLSILYQASQQSSVLIVAVNTDSYLRRAKSPSRPFMPLQERMKHLACLAYVDFVVSFEENTPLALLERIRPDVHINGEEYGKDCIEAPLLRRMGTRLHLIPRRDSFSSSSLIEKIRQSCD